jgi:hypothetical protein
MGIHFPFHKNLIFTPKERTIQPGDAFEDTTSS